MGYDGALTARSTTKGNPRRHMSPVRVESTDPVVAAVHHGSNPYRTPRHVPATGSRTKRSTSSATGAKPNAGAISATMIPICPRFR